MKFSYLFTYIFYLFSINVHWSQHSEMIHTPCEVNFLVHTWVAQIPTPSALHHVPSNKGLASPLNRRQHA